MSLKPYHNIRIINAAGDGNEYYYEKIQDGIDLIRRYVKNPERILALNFENPFNMALSVMPPKFVPTVWHYGMSYTDNRYPDYDEIIQDVKYLILPAIRFPYKHGTYHLEEIYISKINQDFRLRAETHYWKLYARNDDTEAS